MSHLDRKALSSSRTSQPGHSAGRFCRPSWKAGTNSLRRLGREPTDDLQHACRIWNAPRYGGLKLTGYLANRIESWGLFPGPVNLAVRNTDQTPFRVASTDDDLDDVPTKEWPHDILDSLP